MLKYIYNKDYFCSATSQPCSVCVVLPCCEPAQWHHTLGEAQGQETHLHHECNTSCWSAVPHCPHWSVLLPDYSFQIVQDNKSAKSAQSWQWYKILIWPYRKQSIGSYSTCDFVLQFTVLKKQSTYNPATYKSVLPVGFLIIYSHKLFFKAFLSLCIGEEQKREKS